MHLNDVRKYQADKDHLMRSEGTHPVNYSYKHKMEFSEPKPIDYDSMEYPA